MSKDATSQVERYLAEVDAALTARGVTDRNEILAGLREHIGADGRDKAEVLRELGDPVMIAAAAADEIGVADNKRSGARGRTWFPILALVLIFVGALLLIFVVPALLLLAGLVMLWLSPAWTVREKLWGTLLVPAPGLAIAILLGVATSVQSCVTTTSGEDTQTVCGASESIAGGVVATIVLAVIALVGVIVTIRLARRALARG